MMPQGQRSMYMPPQAKNTTKTVHPNKIPYTKPANQPKHNKYVVELSKPHPQFDGVQKVRREEIDQLLKKGAQRQKDGKYIDIKKYKFKPDVWEIEGKLIYECPYEHVDDPDQNIFVKKIYEERKENIREKKIQILELQKKAKIKKEQRLKEEQEKIDKYPKRKYSNELEEYEIQQLDHKINHYDEYEDQDQNNDQDNEQEQDDDQDQDNEQDNDQDQDNEQDNDQDQQDECRQIDDFGDFDEQVEVKKPKDFDSFDEEDISQSFVSNQTKKSNNNYQSDVANQLENAFSEMMNSQLQ